MTNVRLFALLSLVLAAAATRLFPHPPNLTAIGAIALFAGVHFRSRTVAIAAPLAAALLGDMGLSLLWHGGSRFTFLPLTSYALFAGTAMMGMALRPRNGRSSVNYGFVALATVAGSLLFFVVSNFAVWYGGSGKMYPHTSEGLIACYVAAIPFAQNMLWGNVLYGTALFGAWQMAQALVPTLRMPALGESTATTLACN